MTELSQYINYQVNKGPISVEDIKVLYGANYFSGEQVIRFRINLGKYYEVFTNTIPDFFKQIKKSGTKFIQSSALLI